jgi:hypothetical protein
MSRLASVRSTIGRFSSIRSKAWEGKNPTYVSVFALMSTYDAVLQSEATEARNQNCIQKTLTISYKDNRQYPLA